MSESSAVLEQAIDVQKGSFSGLPNSQDLVAALQATEKSKTIPYDFAALMGTWRLCFITGTKKTRKKAGVALGSGRYLPRVIQIQITYQGTGTDQGWVQNSVSLAGLTLQLTGPIKLWPKSRCLGFDFTQLQISIGGFTAYQGRIKPEAADQEFYQQTLKEQAFFKYFWVTEDGIAARGRGGGLALWSRVVEDS